MTTYVSTGLQRQMLNAGGFKEVMDGSEVRLYAGLRPDSADASIGGATLLCTIKNGSSGITFDADTTPGVLLKPSGETWQGTNVASGTPSFYRMVKSDDTGAASTTAARVQGDVGVVGSDLNISSGALTAGAPQSIEYYAVSVLPAA